MLGLRSRIELLTERDPARTECELLDRVTGPLQNGCPGLDLLPSSPEEAEEGLLRESSPSCPALFKPGVYPWGFCR